MKSADRTTVLMGVEAGTITRAPRPSQTPNSVTTCLVDGTRIVERRGFAAPRRGALWVLPRERGKSTSSRLPRISRLTYCVLSAAGRRGRRTRGGAQHARRGRGAAAVARGNRLAPHRSACGVSLSSSSLGAALSVRHAVDLTESRPDSSLSGAAGTRRLAQGRRLPAHIPWTPAGDKAIKVLTPPPVCGRKLFCEETSPTRCVADHQRSHACVPCQ